MRPSSTSHQRSVPALFGLVWAALALVLGLVLPPSGEALAKKAEAKPEPTRPPLVVVRGLGPVPAANLRLACRKLLAAYPVRCEIRAARSLFVTSSAWHVDREQMDARGALELMFRDRTPDAIAELNITTVDIFEDGKPYVFGLASLTDRIALVSLSRIDDKPKRVDKRLTKLVLHEAGHTIGLHHHDDENCVMRQDPTPRSLDSAPPRLCDECHKLFATQASRLARPGQIALDRARSHLARGETDVARQEFVRTLLSGQFDNGVLNSFGVTFFEARQFNEAIAILKFVIKQDPKLAEAHVNLGLAYQLRAKGGDRSRAIRHFEQALELQPDWKMVAAHLDGLQHAPPSAQGPAAL